MLVFRERENHCAHLASIEAELDSQVAKVEAAARRQAQQDFEAERRAMQDKMEAEVQELQTHLRLGGVLESELKFCNLKVVPKGGSVDEQR